MAKYPLLFSGLLVAGLAHAECDPATSQFYCDNYGGISSTSVYAQPEDTSGLREAARREEARQAEFDRYEPRMVIGPSGSQIYYPGGSDRVWVNYDR